MSLIDVSCKTVPINTAKKKISAPKHPAKGSQRVVGMCETVVKKPLHQGLTEVEIQQNHIKHARASK